MACVQLFCMVTPNAWSFLLCKKLNLFLRFSLFHGSAVGTFSSVTKLCICCLLNKKRHPRKSAVKSQAISSLSSASSQGASAGGSQLTFTSYFWQHRLLKMQGWHSHIQVCVDLHNSKAFSGEIQALLFWSPKCLHFGASEAPWWSLCFLLSMTPAFGVSAGHSHPKPASCGWF